MVFMKETSKTILIVEDEKPLAHVLKLKLEHEGFSVTTVFTGQEAKDILSTQSFDLILTDIIIPGFNGFDLITFIKEKKMKTPVIVMTNLNQEEDKQKIFELGASDYFVKSNISISEIVAKVKAKAS